MGTDTIPMVQKSFPDNRNWTMFAHLPNPMSVNHFICPGCGAEVRVGSNGCPRCTRQPKTKRKSSPKPWEQDEAHDGLDLDLPEDDTFDYDNFIAGEFGGQPKRSGKEWLWWVTAVALIIALFYVFVL